ncbi:MAG: hypothetical protein VXX04_07445, partial [Actinomycetota bacterium]|nr:hypothetical protein [Actinomycetota bacterium]
PILNGVNGQLDRTMNAYASAKINGKPVINQPHVVSRVIDTSHIKVTPNTTTDLTFGGLRVTNEFQHSHLREAMRIIGIRTVLSSIFPMDVVACVCAVDPFEYTEAEESSEGASDEEEGDDDAEEVATEQDRGLVRRVDAVVSGWEHWHPTDPVQCMIRRAIDNTPA